MSSEPKCKESQAANSQAGGPSQESDSVTASPPGGAGALFMTALSFMGPAVGNSVKVRSCIAPSPLNLSLDLIMCDELQDPMPGTLDFLSQPLRDFQDRQSAGLGEGARLLLEKELCKLEAQAKFSSPDLGEDLSAEDLEARLDKLRRALRSNVLLEDLEPGQLSRGLGRCLGGAATVFYKDPAFNALLDAAGKESALDWRVLLNGFLGRSFHGSSFDAKAAQVVFQPAVSAFINGASATLGRFFASENPLIFQFAGQVVLLQSAASAPETPIDSVLAGNPLDGLAQLVSDLLVLRESGDEFIIKLCPEADRNLADFSRQQISRGASAPQCERRFTQNAPIIAVKIAAASHLLSAQRTQPISASVTAKSIKLAERKCQDTAKLAEVLSRQSEEAELARIADKMYGFLAEMGRTQRWPLWMRFDHHPKDLMLAAFELLIRTGRARGYPDGTVETIDLV